MDKLTLEQAVVISAYTGYMLCPFSAIHEEVEKRLGRPVFTHEFPSIHESDIMPAFRDDFVAMAVKSQQHS
jgi:hypothetical protein